MKGDTLILGSSGDNNEAGSVLFTIEACLEFGTKQDN